MDFKTRLIMYLIQINGSLYLSQDGEWCTKFKSLAKIFQTEDLANECIKQLKKQNINLTFKTTEK